MSAWQQGSAGLLLICSAVGVWSAGLQVSPVKLQFAGNQQAQVLQLNNSSDHALNAQVRVLRWSQRDHQDVLEPSDEILASPAIVRVLPGQPQTIRVIRAQQVSSALEQSFRVLVDELPAPPGPGSQAQAGLQLLMRYSIPVFVSPHLSAETARVQAAAAQAVDLGHISASLLEARLVVRNEGLLALRISQLSAVLPGGERLLLSEGLLGYVLPQQDMSWPLPRPLVPGTVLEAQFNDDLELRRLPLRDARP